jgi:hypothetical protein
MPPCKVVLTAVASALKVVAEASTLLHGKKVTRLIDAVVMPRQKYLILDNADLTIGTVSAWLVYTQRALYSWQA